MSGERAFSLSRSLPSALSADNVPSLFECFIGTMPRCDSSGTYTRAVRPKPSPAVLQLTFTAGVSEVSRFSCKFLGVLWGLRLRRTIQVLALALVPMLPSAHNKVVGVRIYSFRS